jgi:hypothetical protein
LTARETENVWFGPLLHEQRHFKGITLHLLARIIAWSPVLVEIKLI